MGGFSLLIKGEVFWDNFEDDYVYNYLRESIIYEPEGKTRLERLEDTHFFYNLSRLGEDLYFRTSEYNSPFAFIHCISSECWNYTLYKQFKYDPITETILLGFRFNKETRRYYMLDGERKPFANLFEYGLPFDLIKVFWTNYYWYGIFGVFVPTRAERFEFKMDYGDHKNFTWMKSSYSKTFSYQKKKYEGHKIEIQFSGGVYFDYKVVYENHKLTYCYSPQGILYSYKDEGELFSNYTGSDIKLKESEMSYELILSESSEFNILTDIFLFLGLITIVVFMKIRRYLDFNRKDLSSSTTPTTATNPPKKKTH